MPVPPRVNLVTLGVVDLERETAFYRALGWPLSSSSVAGEVSFFATTGCVVALFGHVSLAEDATVPVEPPPAFRGVATAINVGSPAEVDAALTAATDAGGRLVKPGQPVFWGGYSGYFADPEGHLWEVAHNPYWEVDDKGVVVLPT
jgi:catechol 2,3-dioxygenase-like lactoylglutathione lyase family enzyme